MMMPPMECPTKLILVLGPKSMVLNRLLSSMASRLPKTSRESSVRPSLVELIKTLQLYLISRQDLNRMKSCLEAWKPCTKMTKCSPFLC